MAALARFRRMPRSGLLFASAALAGCLALATPGAAQEINFKAPEASEEMRDQLRGASLLIGIRDDGTEATAQDLVAAAQADYLRMVGVLYDNAYFGGTVSITVNGREAAAIPPLNAPSRIDEIVLNVDPGPRFMFGETSIGPLPDGAEITDAFRRGEPAETAVLRAAASDAVSAWRDAGHAKAEIGGQRITAVHPRQELNADISVAPGPRLRFGTLQVPTDSYVRAPRIREIAGLPVGETFSPRELERAATRLRRSGAFRSVSLAEAETANPDGTLDIGLRLVDEKPRRFGFGAELSSIEGVRLTAFWLHRNLLGGGERLRFDAEVAGIEGNTGGIDYTLSARFDRPATITPDTGLFVTALAMKLDEPEFNERAIEIGAGLRHSYTDNLTVEGGLSFRFARIEDDLGDREFRMLAAPLSVTWDRRDNALNPARGFYFDGTATPWLGLNGTKSAVRFFTDTRGYFSFGNEDRFTLAGRVQAGSVAGAVIEDVPPDMLFFSGGGGTVRGQDYQSLSLERAGRTVGGRSFIGLSGELRADVTERFGAVAFMDKGYISEDALPGAGSPNHSGAGLGLRYQTGIGPIRLDVATPTSGDDAYKEVQVYIGIGQAF